MNKDMFYTLTDCLVIVTDMIAIIKWFNSPCVWIFGVSMAFAIWNMIFLLNKSLSEV